MTTSSKIQQLKEKAPSVYAIYSVNRTLAINKRLEDLRYRYAKGNESEKENIMVEVGELQSELKLYIENEPSANSSGDQAKALTPSETETL